MGPRFTPGVTISDLPVPAFKLFFQMGWTNACSGYYGMVCAKSKAPLFSRSTVLSSLPWSGRGTSIKFPSKKKITSCWIPCTGVKFVNVSQGLPTTSYSHSSSRFRSDSINKAVEDEVAKALARVKAHMEKLQSLDLEKALDSGQIRVRIISLSSTNQLKTTGYPPCPSA